VPLFRTAGEGLSLAAGVATLRGGNGAGFVITGTQLVPVSLDGPSINTSNPHLGTTETAGSTLIAAGDNSDYRVGEPNFRPLSWCMDPTTNNSLAQPVNSGGSSPTVTPMTDATTGRPFLRVESADTSLHVVTLMDLVNGGARGLNRDETSSQPYLLAFDTGRSVIELRLRFGGGPPTVGGFAFNVDPVNVTPLFFGVGRGADNNHWDSCVSGTNDGHPVANQRATDGSFSWPRLWIELDVNFGGVIHYAYTCERGVGAAAFQQARTSSGVRASGNNCGIYLGGHAGYVDVAELTIWRDEINW
jgi:hypothetical protein